MEKHVGLNPAWFEPGPDGVSPFEREYRNAPGLWTSTSIAAAFRALMAEKAAEPPALEVGDVVRLERYESGTEGMYFWSDANKLVGKECAIESISKVYPNRVHVGGIPWPVSALTLVRRAGEAALVDLGKVVQVPEMVSPKVAEFIQAKDSEIARLMEQLESVRRHYCQACNARDSQAGRINHLTDELHARNDEIVGLRADVERLDKWRVAMNGLTPNGSEYVQDLDRCVSAIRERFQSGHEAKKALARVTAERDALKRPCAVCAGTGWSQSRDGSEHLSDPVPCAACVNGEVAGSWTIMAAELYRTQLRADALQARIDAGVRAWSEWKQQCGALWLWAFPGCSASPEWAAVCNSLDAQPIADHIVEPNKMVDERKGERRKGAERPCQCPCGGWRLNHEVGDTSSPDMRFHEQRVNPTGTRADRKGN